MSSTFKDLPKAHNYFKNWGNRNLTFKQVQNWICRFQALKYPNSWSPMLRWMNGWRIGAQSCLMLLKSSTAIDEYMLQQSSILHAILRILLPKHSNMLMDQGLIKNKARFVKNFEEKVREKIVKICETRSRSENYEVLIQFLLWLCYIYVLLMMHANHD